MEVCPVPKGAEGEGPGPALRPVEWGGGWGEWVHHAGQEGDQGEGGAPEGEDGGGEGVGNPAEGGQLGQGEVLQHVQESGWGQGEEVGGQAWGENTPRPHLSGSLLSYGKSEHEKPYLECLEVKSNVRVENLYVWGVYHTLLALLPLAPAPARGEEEQIAPFRLLRLRHQVAKFSPPLTGDRGLNRSL